MILAYATYVIQGTVLFFVWGHRSLSLTLIIEIFAQSIIIIYYRYTILSIHIMLCQLCLVSLLGAGRRDLKTVDENLH
jgi:hypothetical protein